MDVKKILRWKGRTDEETKIYKDNSLFGIYLCIYDDDRD